MRNIFFESERVDCHEKRLPDRACPRFRSALKKERMKEAIRAMLLSI